jgi:small subunit ribosomal protein S4e
LTRSESNVSTCCCTDVISIEKTDEVFRLLYDTKGRFIAHRISAEESKYKLGKVRRVEIGKKGIPYLVTHDGRTIRYPDPLVKVHDTVKIDLETVCLSSTVL